MITVPDLIPRIRSILKHPSVQKLKTADIIFAISRAVAIRSTELKLVNQNWFWREGEIVVPVGVTEFNNALPECHRVYSIQWINPANLGVLGPEVTITDWDNVDQVSTQYYRTAADLQAGGIQDVIASAFAYQGFGAQMKWRVTPVHSVQTRYKVWFAPASQPLNGHGDVIDFPDEFWYLIELQAADALLGHCEYPDNETMALRISIASQLKLADTNFKWNKGSTSQKNISVSKGYTPPGRGGGFWGRGF